MVLFFFSSSKVINLKNVIVWYGPSARVKVFDFFQFFLLLIFLIGCEKKVCWGCDCRCIISRLCRVECIGLDGFWEWDVQGWFILEGKGANVPCGSDTNVFFLPRIIRTINALAVGKRGAKKIREDSPDVPLTQSSFFLFLSVLLN